MIRAKTPATTMALIHFKRFCGLMTERPVEPDDILTGAVDLVPDVRQLSGLLLDALEAIMADDQAFGRGAPFVSEAPASFRAS